MTSYRIWDLPTRVFHWLLVGCIVGLLITGNVGGWWMDWHFRLGYAVLCLLVFRVIWGFVGGYWSRFAAFIYSPSALLQYLRGRSPLLHRVGHNPLGALSVWTLLVLLCVQVLSGLLSDDQVFYRGPWAEWAPAALIDVASAYHKAVGKLLVVAWVVLHLLALLFYKVVKREALVLAMVRGDKSLATAVPASADHAAQRRRAVVVLVVSALITTGLVYLRLT